MNKHPLAHGSLDGPKQDTNSSAKQMADRDRARKEKERRENYLALWLYNLEREDDAFNS